MTRRIRRTATLSAFMCVGLVAFTAGCGSGPGSTGSPAAHLRNHVASEVHVTLNRYGVAVQAGVVSCEGPGPDGAIYCEASTAYEPQAEVLARFAASSASGSSASSPGAPTAGGAGAAGMLHGSCPGTLRITVGGAPLATAREDPCR